MELFHQISSSVFQGVSPKIDFIETYGLNPLLQNDHMSNFFSLLDPETHNLIAKAQLINIESLTLGLSFFDFLLYNIKSILIGDPWDKNIPTNGAISLDTCNEFYRIFGVLCVAMVHTVPPKDYTIEQIFGDSLLWCGQTMIALLGENNLNESLDFINHALRIADDEEMNQTYEVGTINSSTLKSMKNKMGDSARIKILPKFKSIRNRRKFVDSILAHFKNVILKI